jgi:hypothetical protein
MTPLLRPLPGKPSAGAAILDATAAGAGSVRTAGCGHGAGLVGG